MKPAERRARDCKQHLTTLTAAVREYLTWLDAEMTQPSTPDRGSRIAKASNALEMANDQARYFGLGIDYRKDKKP